MSKYQEEERYKK
jgi:hypothetical protein